MNLPVNEFKRLLAARQQQLGIWNSIPGPVVVEVLSSAGFDWVLLDTEHSLTDIPDLMGMLQAAAGYPGSALVRVAGQDPVLMKRVLDLGAQTVMVPYVQSAEEAAAVVRAMRYAPRGMRGVSGMSRATRYGQVRDYAKRAEEELCLIVQVETAEAVGRIADIAAVDGVDALFIGPADLAASMGHPGDLAHPEVVAMIERAIKAIVAAGKPAGILVLDQGFARQCMGWGTTFTAVGIDMSILAGGVRALHGAFA
ncbi:MAG: HpcH/HpaI aldolase/citrate lyase family protein [Rhodobacter sp.]|jgi:4-hydroxy-2-oxoheptanedioate aldolase|nr:HpcH/HpaI aldolase/citrate lyase family protein [Rhodobacter sp.]MBK8439842.1 HpcH/HpaI aldolase/citrate lyase family protein [Rhodobacter sp.]